MHTCAHTQAFGDVRHLHSALKPRGVIVVTYFDLRAATNAVATLNGTLIQNAPISVCCADASEKDPGNVNQVSLSVDVDVLECIFCGLPVFLCVCLCV
jgi:hypothetical protein